MRHSRGLCILHFQTSYVRLLLPCVYVFVAISKETTRRGKGVVSVYYELLI